MVGLAVMLLTLGAIALSFVWSGFVLTFLWGWFVVPVFGLPPLTLVPAIGIATVVSYLTSSYHPDPEVGAKEKTARAIAGLVFLAVKPAVALIAGWVVKQWM